MNPHATLCFDFSGPLGSVRLGKIKKRIGTLLLAQTHDRIDQSGDDEERLAPLDFPRVNGATDTPLKSTGTHLEASLTYGVDARSVWVGSNFIGARVHQLGTTGKGGKLPPIKPVRARSLFIPMSPRGAKSTKQPGDWKRTYRAKKGKGVGTYSVKQLKRGYLPPTTAAQKSANARADFALLQKVNIRPRRFLKMSAGNRRELIALIAGS